jgi:hypothetical protein
MQVRWMSRSILTLMARTGRGAAPIRTTPIKCLRMDAERGQLVGWTPTASWWSTGTERASPRSAMLLNRLNVHGGDVFGSEWDDDEMYFEPFYDCDGAMHLLEGLVQAEII